MNDTLKKLERVRDKKRDLNCDGPRQQVHAAFEDGADVFLLSLTRAIEALEFYGDLSNYSAAGIPFCVDMAEDGLPEQYQDYGSCAQKVLEEIKSELGIE